MAEKIPSEDKRAVEDEESSSESDRGEEHSTTTDLSGKTEDKSAIEDEERSGESDMGEDLSTQTDLGGRTEDKNVREKDEISSESDKGEAFGSRTDLSSRAESEDYSQTDSKMSEEVTDVVGDPQEERRMIDEFTDRLELSSPGNLKDEIKEWIRRFFSSHEPNSNTNFQQQDTDEDTVISYRLTRNPLMIPAFVLSNVRDALERARTWGQTLVPIYLNFCSIDDFMNYLRMEAIKFNAKFRRRLPAGNVVQPVRPRKPKPVRVYLYKNVPIDISEDALESVQAYESYFGRVVRTYITSNQELYNEIYLEAEAKKYIDEHCNMQ